MKKCKVCGIEKELIEFDRCSTFYRGNCKECRRKSLRTGKPNTGRFQKGRLPPPTCFKKGQISCHKGIPAAIWIKSKIKIPLEEKKYWRGKRENSRTGTSKTNIKYYEWAQKIKERDGKCQKCSITERLEAHHIVPWKESEELRYEMSNGITYCKSCHAMIERIYEFEKNPTNFRLRNKK